MQYLFDFEPLTNSQSPGCGYRHHHPSPLELPTSAWPALLPGPSQAASSGAACEAWDPADIDAFRTRYDADGNVRRVSVPVTCHAPDCGEVVWSKDIWTHLREVHYPGTKSSHEVECRWDNCASGMKRTALHRHVDDKHLHFKKLHCPYCHHTARDTHFRSRHGLPANCPRRALYEARDAETWEKVENCGWCQALV